MIKKYKMKNKEDILKRWEDFGFLEGIEKIEDKQELAELYELAAESVIFLDKENTGDNVLGIELDTDFLYELYGNLNIKNSTMETTLFPIVRRVFVKLKEKGIKIDLPGSFIKNLIIRINETHVSDISGVDVEAELCVIITGIVVNEMSE